MDVISVIYEIVVRANIILHNANEGTHNEFRCSLPRNRTMGTVQFLLLATILSQLCARYSLIYSVSLLAVLPFLLINSPLSCCHLAMPSGQTAGTTDSKPFTKQSYFCYVVVVNISAYMHHCLRTSMSST